ncbi:MAG: 2,3-dihydroxybiphenyl 1,2-dioxygenase [Gammaproteobacteria bacterium]|nr:2,3-dihydroxybiphenyl 1,2-dioxygenase [Gammaproteobacteria bacterium]
MNVKSLGYIGIESSHIEQWQRYCSDFLGLMNMSTDSNELSYRMDDQAWRLSIQQGKAEDLVFAGYDARDQRTLMALCNQLSELGCPPKKDDALAARRGVSCLYVVQDPDGLQVELYYGATEAAETPFVSPAGVGKFVTGDQGFGHIVLYTKNYEKKYAFYTEGLGFFLSDTILMFGKLMLTFLHCNPRHHTIALAAAPTNKHLNHFMVQVNSLNEVGYANDRALAMDIPVTTLLGCHTNDRMVSFYTKTPSGFDVELGYGARTVDKNWSVAHHNSPSIWGHRSAE